MHTANESSIDLFMSFESSPTLMLEIGHTQHTGGFVYRLWWRPLRNVEKKRNGQGSLGGADKSGQTPERFGGGNIKI